MPGGFKILIIPVTSKPSILVSVVIINYRTFNLTCNCIKSVIDKTKAIPFEIILVDNGSTTQESTLFQKQFPNIKYVKTGSNLGFAKGNNEGINNSSGEIILLLNSDTELINDAISMAAEIILADSSIGVLSGQLLYPNGTQQHVLGSFPKLSSVIKDLFRITRFYSREKRKYFYLGSEWDYNKPADGDWVWGAFFMFRKKDIQLFPGKRLHEDFFMYFEDVQWCYYFKNVIHKRVVYRPEPKVIHFIGQSSESSRSEREKYFTTILPNESHWMVQTKGRVYTFLYYFLKSVYYFSLRRSEDVNKGKIFLRYSFTSL